MFFNIMLVDSDNMGRNSINFGPNTTEKQVKNMVELATKLIFINHYHTQTAIYVHPEEPYCQHGH